MTCPECDQTFDTATIPPHSRDRLYRLVQSGAITPLEASRQRLSPEPCPGGETKGEDDRRQVGLFGAP